MHTDPILVTTERHNQHHMSRLSIPFNNKTRLITLNNTIRNVLHCKHPTIAYHTKQQQTNQTKQPTIIVTKKTKNIIKKSYHCRNLYFNCGADTDLRYELEKRTRYKGAKNHQKTNHYRQKLTHHAQKAQGRTQKG